MPSPLALPKQAGGFGPLVTLERPFAMDFDADDETLAWDEALPSRMGTITVMLIGRRGRGKTLTMTALAKYQQERFIRANAAYRIISNYRLSFLRAGVDIYSPYVLSHAMEYPAWLSDAFMVLDEIQTAIPSRRALAGTNVFMSTFLTQIRHRNTEIAFTTQFPQVIDYQTLLQIDLFCEVDILKRKRGIPDELVLYVHDYWGQWSGNFGKRPWPPYKWEADEQKRLTGMSVIAGMYSTEQIVAPTFGMDEDERDRLIAEEAEKLADMFGEDTTPEQDDKENAEYKDAMAPAMQEANYHMKHKGALALYQSWDDLLARMPNGAPLRAYTDAAADLTNGDVGTQAQLASKLKSLGWKVAGRGKEQKAWKPK